MLGFTPTQLGGGIAIVVGIVVFFWPQLVKLAKRKGASPKNHNQCAAQLIAVAEPIAEHHNVTFTAEDGVITCKVEPRKHDSAN